MLALRSHWLRRRVRALHGVAERRRAWGGTEARHRAEARAQRTYHALARGFWPRALQSFIGFMPRGVGVKAIGLADFFLFVWPAKHSKLVRAFAFITTCVLNGSRLDLIPILYFDRRL